MAEESPETERIPTTGSGWLGVLSMLGASLVLCTYASGDELALQATVATSVFMLLAGVRYLGAVSMALAPTTVAGLSFLRGDFGDRMQDSLLLALAALTACIASRTFANRQRSLVASLNESRLAQQRGMVRDTVNEALAIRRRNNFVEREIVRAQRYGREVTVAIAEVDNLDLLLQARGPDTVTRVLAQLGELFSRDSRLPDGGLSDDMQLMFVLPETPLDGGRVVAERVRLGFQALHMLGADDIPLTVSVGVASFPDDGHQADEVITAARESLDRAAAAGGNRTMLSRAIDGLPPGWSGAT